MSRTGLLALVAFAASALAVPSPPPEVPEECRPKPPAPGKERAICCEMPRPISTDNDKFKDTFLECKKHVMEAHPEAAPQHHGPPPPNGSPPPPPPPPHGGPPHHHMLFGSCLDECFFNKTGLLTSEKQLNETAIIETLGKVLDSDSVWTPIVEPAIKTCVKASNENNKDEEIEGCMVGPHKFIKCLMREMYLNCPSAVWQDNEECKAEKELIEKCPNLHGPPHGGPPPHGHPPHGHPKKE